MEGKVEHIDRNNGIYKVIVGTEVFTVKHDRGRLVFIGGEPLKIEDLRRAYEGVKILREFRRVGERKGSDKELISPMAGKVLAVKVKSGDIISKGDVLLLLESMKMINEIRSPRSGVVKRVHVKVGDSVKKGDVLVEFE